MAVQKTLTHSFKRLVPARRAEEAHTDTCNLIPSTSFARGLVLGQVTAAGPTQGKLKARNAAKATDPAAAPVPTEGAAGTLAAGVYNVAYAWKNAQGHTLISPIAAVTIAGSKQIAVAAVTPLPAGVTSVDWFISIAVGSPVLAFVANNNGAAFSINALPAAGAAAPPSSNTAYTATDGSHKAVGFLMYDVTTDEDGNHYIASIAGGKGNPAYDEVEYYYTGEFKKSDLVGYDAGVLLDLGGRELLGTELIRIP
jgi:hypothetical protein